MLSLKARCYLNFLRRNVWLLTPTEKVRNYVRYKCSKHQVRIEPTTASPVFMTISLTRRCNMSCRFCIVGDVLNKRAWREHEADLDGVARLLEHPVARRCLYVMLTGGEPLLHPHVVDVVRMIKSRRHLVSINTNGLLLPRSIDALQVAGIDMINISYYEENAAALDAIVERAASMAFTKLLMVIGREHLEDADRIEGVLRLARQSGCGRVFFQNVYPHVDHQASEPILPVSPMPRGTETRPIHERDADLYAEVKERMKRTYPDVAMFWPAPVPDAVTSKMKQCRMPWYLFVVDADGKLGLCSSHASCTERSIFDMPVTEVMNTDLWTETRRGLLSNDDDVPPACVGCYGIHDEWRRDM